MTVSVAELSVMTEQAKEYVNQGATLLKVKLDDQAVVDKIAAIRTVAPIGTLFELYSHTNWETYSFIYKNLFDTFSNQNGLQSQSVSDRIHRIE